MGILSSQSDNCPGSSAASSEDRSHTPTPALVTSGGVAVSSGGDRNCAMLAGGSIRCWGGAICGDGSTTDNLNLRLVVGGTSFVAVGVGRTQSCGVATDGRIHWCGQGDFGVLGDGYTIDRLTPAAAAGASPTRPCSGSATSAAARSRKAARSCCAAASSPTTASVPRGLA